MTNEFKNLFPNFNPNGPGRLEALDTVESQFGCSLPSQYRGFMAAYNGGEGFIGQHYLILWKMEKLVGFNRDHELRKYAPGLLLFGSDGGGEAFAFDLREGQGTKIRIVPFIGMSLQDAKVVADSFDGSLSRLADSNRSLFE